MVINGAGTQGGQRDPSGKTTAKGGQGRPGGATTTTGGRPSIGGWPDKSGNPGSGGRPDKAGSNGGGGGRPDRLAKPCYSEKVCQFVDDKIAEMRESVKGTKFCLRDVCKAAKEGVDEFEKFVRGRRGSDPRKVTTFGTNLP